MSCGFAYTIVESATRGKIVIAARDLLPGELVMEEREPILFFTNELANKYESFDPNMKRLLAAFSTFNEVLSPANKEKFLALYGPTSGKIADYIRSFGSRVALSGGGDLDPTPFTSEEVELFVKVSSITRLNLFGTDNGFAIFDNITRVAHSCASNCNYVLTGKQAWCYTKQPILAGEELTIPYMSDRDIEPIHERRHKYLELKEFTCHCRRCDALGDDTRQFDCSDMACKGVMMIHQPINRKEVRITGLAYDRVEYVEPHLLPCTVCHKMSSIAYQDEMFAVEAKLPALSKDFTDRYNQLAATHQVKKLEPMRQELACLKLPRRHVAAFPLLRVELRLKLAIFVANGEPMRVALEIAVREYIEVHETAFCYPASCTTTALSFASILCCKSSPVPVFSAQEEKEMCQKALRMHLIQHGRNHRNARLDEATALALDRLVSLQFDADVCAFCGESPSHTALTLRRCGRCRAACYCSEECQRAHWKVHKKDCNA